MKKTCFLLILLLSVSFIYPQIKWRDDEITISNPMGSGKSLKLVASENYVFSAWINYDYEGTEWVGKICYAVSTNYGSNWSKPKILTTKMGYKSDLFIGINGSIIYIFWKNEFENSKTINMNKSHDFGENWLKNEKILYYNNFQYEYPYDIQLKFNLNSIFLVYSVGNGSYVSDIYFNCSHDFGDNWLSSPKRLSTGEPLVNSVSDFPSIFIEGNRIFVVWEDFREGYASGSVHEDQNLYFNRSLDNGLTWEKNDIRIDVSDYQGARGGGIVPKIIAKGNMVYVFFNGDRYHPGLYLKYSNDFGSTWSNKANRVDNNHYGGPRHVHIDKNSTLHCFWHSNHKIYYSYSRNLGEYWSTDQVLGEGYWINFKFLHKQNKFYILWQKGEYSSSILPKNGFNYSKDFGKSWLNDPILISANVPSYSQQIAISGDHVFCAWRSVKNNNHFIFFNRTNRDPVVKIKPVVAGCQTKTLSLDGSGSFDPDGDKLSYKWRYITRPEGSTALIQDPFNAIASFTPDLAGKYRIRLKVKDSYKYAQYDEIVFQVGETAVAVIEGASNFCSVPGIVNLSGALSYSNCGSVSAYAWEILSKPEGSRAVIADPSKTKLTFSADLPGEYLLSLKVKTANGEWSAPVTRKVTAAYGNPPDLNLSATASAGHQVRLLLEVSPSAHCPLSIGKYLIERKALAGDYQTLVTVYPEDLIVDGGILKFTFTDERVNPGVQYRYKVTAYAPNGQAVATASTISDTP